MGDKLNRNFPQKIKTKVYYLQNCCVVQPTRIVHRSETIQEEKRRTDCQCSGAVTDENTDRKTTSSVLKKEITFNSNNWAILPTKKNSHLRIVKNKFFDFFFFIAYVEVPIYNILRATTEHTKNVFLNIIFLSVNCFTVCPGSSDLI